MRWWGGLFVFSALTLIGCQMQPTKTSETSQRDLVQVLEKAQKPITLTENTVVLDARSEFDYGLNKILNSRHFQWETLADNAKTGELLRDPRNAALRLSLVGVVPSTPVVIVGNGQAGEGQEGRLAWNLLCLGFHDVQVSDIEAFRHSMTPNSEAPPLNEKPWTVNPRTELQVSKAEFLKIAHNPRGRLDSHTFLIDARSEKEYLAQGQRDLGAINIEWKQFYNAQGRPSSAIVARMRALGMSSNDRIILLSNRGVRSASATYALIALGFSHVQNFNGGLQALK